MLGGVFVDGGKDIRINPAAGNGLQTLRRIRFLSTANFAVFLDTTTAIRVKPRVFSAKTNDICALRTVFPC